MRLRGALLTLTTACMFGLGAVLAKIAVLELSPFVVTFLDLALGFVFLSPYLIATGTPLFRRLTVLQYRDIFLASIFGTALPLLLIVYGLGLTTAIKGGFLIQLQGLAAMLFAMLFLGERINFRQGISVAVLGIGAVLILAKHIEPGLWHNLNKGDMLVFAGAIGLGFGFVPAKRLAEDLSGLRLTALRLLVGAVAIAPMLLLPGGLRDAVRVASLPPSSLVILLVYVSTNFCLAYITLHAGLRLLKAWEAAAIMQTMSIFSTLFAVVLLDEWLTATQAVGGIVTITGGIALAWGSKQSWRPRELCRGGHG